MKKDKPVKEPKPAKAPKEPKLPKRPVMLFNLTDDPHETRDLAADRPDVVAAGLARLEAWHAEQMAKSDFAVDPMQVILREGGPFHTSRMLGRYCEHLRKTGRAHFADELTARYGKTNIA